MPPAGPVHTPHPALPRLVARGENEWRLRSSRAFRGRARAKLSHEEFSQAHQTLTDRRGEVVRFEDQPEAPEIEAFWILLASK